MNLEGKKWSDFDENTPRCECNPALLPNGGCPGPHNCPMVSYQEQMKCEHEIGTPYQKYDADGCGYYIWVCDNCGYEEFDL